MTKTVRGLILIAIVGTAPLAAQQSIIGKVQNAATGDPIEEAAVRVVRESAQVDRTATSELNGRFSFQGLPPGSFEVAISKPGYLTEELNLSLAPRQVIELEVLLRSAAEQRQTVEVNAAIDRLDTGRAQTSVTLGRADLERVPDAYKIDITRLVTQLVPGAVPGHDNFVHLKGNELSLHQFVNGVAFLDNPHAHFTPSYSPQVIESVNIITGGMPAEFGNRLGGVLDIVTKSGRDVGGGSVTLGAGTIVGRNAAFEYGVGRGKWDAYVFGSGFSDGRFLNPPQKREIHDLSYGSRNLLRLGYTPGAKDHLGLLVSAGGINFQLPNTADELAAGRDALRRTRENSAIFSWQRTVSPEALLTTSLYHRYVSDKLLGTTDPLSPFGQGFRRTLTEGAKVDALIQAEGHTIKTGVDLAMFSLNEDFRFHPREDHDESAGEVLSLAGRVRDPKLPRINLAASGLPQLLFSEAALSSIDFRSRRRGGEGGFYIQDRFSPWRNFTVHAGLRYDRYSLVGTDDLLSPRVGLSYHLARTGTVLRAVYSRYFVPPPLEYIQLASALGTGAVEEDEHDEDEKEHPGPVQSLTQHYFEFGFQQPVHRKLILDVAGFHHQGRNAFENAELSNTRLFVPTNFARERTWGADVSLRLRPLNRLGLFGYLNYSHINTNFFGPVSGGLGGEEAAPGQHVTPAFDQRHTGSAAIGYRHNPSAFRIGLGVGYGSGTPAELNDVQLRTLRSGLPVPLLSGGEAEDAERLVRLPDHWTFDFWTGVAVWKKERKSVDLQFSVENLGDRTYAITKESEATPVQYAGRRRFLGRLRFRF